MRFGVSDQYRDLQCAGEGSSISNFAMVLHGVAVALVAYVLEDTEGSRTASERCMLLTAGNENSIGRTSPPRARSALDLECTRAGLVNTEVVEDLHRSAELTFSAIDQQQIRQVILLKASSDATAQHFAHARVIVRAASRFETVAAVVFARRHTFDKHGHGGDGVVPLDVRVVKASMRSGNSVEGFEPGGPPPFEDRRCVGSESEPQRWCGANSLPASLVGVASRRSVRRGIHSAPLAARRRRRARWAEDALGDQRMVLVVLIDEGRQGLVWGRFGVLKDAVDRLVHDALGRAPADRPKPVDGGSPDILIDRSFGRPFGARSSLRLSITSRTLAACSNSSASECAIIFSVSRATTDSRRPSSNAIASRVSSL